MWGDQSQNQQYKNKIKLIFSSGGLFCQLTKIDQPVTTAYFDNKKTIASADRLHAGPFETL